MSILDEMELGTLKGMAVYWREVFGRDDAKTRGCIALHELTTVTEFLGAEKVLRIINAYVEHRSDKEPT